jgi:hypothetical protein
MDRTVDVSTGGRVVARSRARDASYQAYQILHWAFVLAPTLAGLDKFFERLTQWEQYLAPIVRNTLGIGSHKIMMIIGAIELVAAFVVAVKPKVGAWIVAAWLAGIVVNLLLLGDFYDVALRDFGLMLGAIALARLSTVYDRPHRSS